MWPQSHKDTKENASHFFILCLGDFVATVFRSEAAKKIILIVIIEPSSLKHYFVLATS